MENKTSHVYHAKVERKKISNKKATTTSPIQVPSTPEEVGGPKGLEPTRYGDWERKGICVDF